LNSSKKKRIILCVVSVASMLGVQVAFADTWSGGRSSALRYTYYDSSVSTYGYGGSFDSARNNWNSISSKVFIYSSLSYNDPKADVYYVGNSSDPTLIGLTNAYKDHSGTLAFTTDLWAYCTVTIYDNNMKSNNMNSSQVISNATHEIGHSLSLDHPYVTSNSAVMKKGIQSIGPTTYDKSELKSKWGS